MAEQIIIEFVGDSSKLEPAVNILEQLGQIDAKAADSFRKGNAELSKRSEALKKVTAEEQKQIKTLKDVEKGVDSLANSFIDGFQEGVVEALSEAGVGAHEFEKALKGIKSSADETTSSQDSLKKQLREMAAELALLESQGKRNTVEYDNLKNKAGQLKDAISDANEAIARAGSDTKGFDNLLELAGGVAGGFAVAQGAAALFGSESEEVQKTLLKVNAAMAILQGLQQIQNVLAKEQFASTAALIGVQRVQALQTALQAGAESSYTVVRYGAIAAQKLLNAVMVASPLGLALLLVGAVAAAWAIFASNNKDAEDAQRSLNDALKEANEYLEAELDGIESFTAAEMAKAKAAGKSALEIEQIEGRGKNRRLATLNDKKNILARTLNDEKIVNKLSEEDYNKLNDDKAKIDKQYDKERSDLVNKSVEFNRKLYV